MLWDIRVGGAGAACRVGEGWDAELNGLAAVGADLVHLRELGPGAGQAHLQPFGFAEPAVLFGFGDAGDEVVADLHQAGMLAGVGPEKRAAQAPLTELTHGPGLAPAGASASERTGIGLLSAVIGHCG